VSLDFEAIGPYQVVRILGQGGMGTVYQGLHVKNQEPVAIKVIASNLAQHQRFRRRFDAEIQTLIKLKHPNIVQLIGFGEEKGMLFYSMEYVDGENLQQQLRREKILPWERVVDLAIDVCSALKHAHDYGVIHRDLKPANLMITSQGKLKLTDFGIAKLFGATDATVEGAVLGTADYMPPEQAEGKPVSVRSDLYSLGSICYAALAGRPPFKGKNIPEILFNVRYGTLTPLIDLAPDVPKELCELIDELLRKEPSLRPPTGLVVGNRLQSLKMGLSKRAKQKPVDNTDVSGLREMTSIDIRTDEELASEADGIAPSDATVVTSNKRRPHAELPSSPKSTPIQDSPSMTAPSYAGPEDSTRIAKSNSEFDVHDRPSGIDHMSKTNFTEVDDSDRRRSSIVVPVAEPTSVWAAWTGVASLLGMLVACAGVIYWLSLPPSANSLHQQIMSGVNAGDDDTLLEIEPIAERFQELYPNDSRHTEIDQVLVEIESLRSMKQLQRRARRGGTDMLDTVEQAFLECLKAQDIDTELAKKKLEALAIVFKSGEKLTSKQQLIVERARLMYEKLSEKGSQARNPAIDALEGQIVWAEANLSGKARAEWLRSVIELFQDKGWARDPIAKAKQLLGKLE
jgi:serine/threonine protein kinase